MKKAFTLLQLIVVMGISAGLLGAGIYGLTSYQRYLQLQSGYNDLVSIIKTQQNRAVNSVSLTALGGQAPYIYALRIDNGNYTLYYCQNVAGSIVCTLDASLGQLSQLASNDLQVTSNCSGVGFLKLSTDVVSLSANAFTGSGSVGNTGTCTFTIEHKVTLQSKQITFNLEENNLSLL